MNRSEIIATWRQRWLDTALPNQIPPEGTWSVFGIVAGFGAGTTRAGIEWLANEALTDPEALPCAVVGPSIDHLRYVLFEGDVGLLRVLPPECLKSYNKTRLEITLDNGAVIKGFSGEGSNRLSSFEFSKAMADAVDGWGPKAEKTWKNLIYATRLGTSPRVVWNAQWSRKDKIGFITDGLVANMSWRDNIPNLSESFVRAVSEFQ